MLSTESIKLDINVPIKMRDGAVIYSDVWRPDTGGKYPTILTRTPYNKNFSFPTRAGYLNPQRFARAGYAVVIEDVRGTSDSMGQLSYSATGDRRWLRFGRIYCPTTLVRWQSGYVRHLILRIPNGRRPLPNRLIWLQFAMTSMIPYAFPFSRKGIPSNWMPTFPGVRQLLAGLAAENYRAKSWNQY
jgi:hypothetical protein